VGDPNPYEAPRSDVSTTLPPVAARDRKIAARMLEARDRGGFSIGLYYRWSALRHLFLLVYFGVVLLLLGAVQLWVPFALMLGIYLGMLLQAHAVARVSTRTWPLTVRITDWETVRKIADGEPI
jgi:hypothetical protein